MVRFINRLTGSEMWVAEDRADEYRAAGHAPADAPAVSKSDTAGKAAAKPRTARKPAKAKE